MKERTSAIIITVILIIIGLIIGAITSAIVILMSSENFEIPYTDFNFYKSQLDINGTHVKETLYFQTNQDYHTLFRTFQSTITTKNNINAKNSVTINTVTCEQGTPYFKINNNCFESPDFTTPTTCPAYTEDNEYGCTFGNTYGFSSGKEYSISSDLKLNPENLFKVNGKYYIKFIAYGRNEHIPLTINNNLIINGDAVYTNQYLSKEYAIIYIPYTGDVDGYNIQNIQNFQYDKPANLKSNLLLTILIIIGIMLMHLLPAILFFSSWYFFGKELIDQDVPEQLSQYPNKRKPWEVAAFFNAPFGKIDKNFFSTMLLDFYHRKIIDLKLVKGFLKQDLMIKLNNEKAIGLVLS
jgi:hypothetical protein